MNKLEIDKLLNNLFEYIEEKGVPIKEATIKSERRQYFKRKEFEKFLENSDNKKEFIQKINPIYQLSENSTIDEIIDTLTNSRILLISYPTVYDSKIKYPKTLIFSNEISEEEKKDRKKFYVLNFQREEKKSHFWLILISILILLFCLLPIWPLPMKLAIWWCSYILLVFIVSFKWFKFTLITIRSAIFLFFYIFGYDIWIFPNLFDDKLGFKDSFYPFISTSKRSETLNTILIRTAIFIFVAYIGVNIYTYPEYLEYAKDHVVEIYNDIFEWGNEKIINYHNGTSISIIDKNDYYRKLVNEEEDSYEWILIN